MPRLTKRFVDGLVPNQADQFFWDDELAGFGVRLLPSGRKTFHAQYRHGGRTRRVKLGLHGTITVDEARRLARQRLGEVAHGHDPAETISRYRQEPSVANVAERFMEEHVKQRCKKSTATEYQRALKLFINPAIGARKISDITRADISALHHKHRLIPYQANRTLGVLSKIFNLSEVWGLRPDGSNPCRHVAKYQERKRERFLSGEEIAKLNEVLNEVEAQGSETPYVCGAFRLLMLTGCRLSEVQTLKWSDISDNYFHLRDSKTGARKVPIGTAVNRILDQIPRLSNNPYVVVGKEEGRHITDLQRPWRRIRTKACLTDVRIHDLRHTFASHAVADGMSLEMIGKLLGHTQIQTTMRYAHLADDPVRQAAEKVSDGLDKFMTTPI